VDGYRTVVVGTDGSESSMRAVTRAAEVAAGENAKLIIASAVRTQAINVRSAARIVRVTPRSVLGAAGASLIKVTAHAGGPHRRGHGPARLIRPRHR